MTFPDSWTRVPVIGNYLDTNGKPLRGKVIARTKQVTVANGSIVVPVMVVFKIDADGNISGLLPATNDPDVTPTGWYWEITELFRGGRTYKIEVDYEATEIDLADAIPLVTPQEMLSIEQSTIMVAAQEAVDDAWSAADEARNYYNDMLGLSTNPAPIELDPEAVMDLVGNWLQDGNHDGIGFEYYDSDNALRARLLNNVPIKTRQLIWSSDIITPEVSDEMVGVSFVVEPLTINTPNGVPTDGDTIVFRFKDDGISRPLVWSTDYVWIVPPVVATTPDKWHYLTAMYNDSTGGWDITSSVVQL